MSKSLTVFFNDTDDSIKFKNVQTGYVKELGSHTMFRTAKWFSIPDNSNSEKYFNGHHMEIQQEDGKPILSFWDNDDNNFILYCCQGTDWRNPTLMQGYNDGGDDIVVGIVLTKTGGKYEVKSYKVLNNV